MKIRELTPSSVVGRICCMKVIFVSADRLVRLKQRRQRSFYGRMADRGASVAQAVESAKLFPKSVVRQFRVESWAR